MRASQRWLAPFFDFAFTFVEKRSKLYVSKGEIEPAKGVSVF